MFDVEFRLKRCLTFGAPERRSVEISEFREVQRDREEISHKLVVVPIAIYRNPASAIAIFGPTAAIFGKFRRRFGQVIPHSVNGSENRDQFLAGELLPDASIPIDPPSLERVSGNLSCERGRHFGQVCIMLRILNRKWLASLHTPFHPSKMYFHPGNPLSGSFSTQNAPICQSGPDPKPASADQQVEGKFQDGDTPLSKDLPNLPNTSKCYIKQPLFPLVLSQINPSYPKQVATGPQTLILASK